MFLAWRNTTDKIKYILFPKDPTQRKEEYRWYQLAMYHVAENVAEMEMQPVSAV